MDVSFLASSAQPPWDEIRQKTMCNSQTNNANAEIRNAPAISARAGESGADSIRAALDKANALRKGSGLAEANGGAAQAENTPPVSTALKNVGPNTYEKIKMNAGRTYSSQVENYGSGDDAAASTLDKSA